MRGEAVRLGRADLLAIAGLITVAVLLPWRLSLAGQILPGPDAFAYFYPLLGYAAERLLDGQLPLWNPHLFLGAPFLANPQAGVFYPVHWLLAWLPAPSLVTATLVLHYALAASGMYLLLRLGLARSRYGAAAGALIFAFSGHLGAQAEHVNQVEALAWLPLQLLLLEVGAVRAGVPGSRRCLAGLGAATITGMQLLIGHAQAVYISHTALLLYGAARPLWGAEDRRALWAVWRRMLVLMGGAVLLGVGLAAVQLGPTLELVGLSVRAGGLDYRQAVSFSFGPGAWLLGLLPHFGGEAPFSEYAAYVGVVGLALASVGVARSGRADRWMVVLVAAGVFLALGIYNPLYYVLFRVVPGFALFRVPARWLVLAVVGASMLAAAGVDRVPTVAGSGRRTVRWIAAVGVAGLGLLWFVSDPRPVAVTVVGWLVAAVLVIGGLRVPSGGRRLALVALLAFELAAASVGLPYSQATSAQVYEAQRRSTQVLLGEGGLGRFLTVSQPGFDSGDMAELSASLGPGLNTAGRYGLLVGAKWQEVLARNLALAWQLYAVDGYDGGVLPTADFLDFERLLVGEEGVAADGRLSEALHDTPPERLLALAGVRYLLSDRVQDVWVGGVYYDLSLGLKAATAGEARQFVLPPFVGDALGVVVRSGEAESPVPAVVARLAFDGLGSLDIVRDQFGVWAEAEDGRRTQLEPVAGRPELLHGVVELAAQPVHLESLTAEVAASDRDQVRGLSLINRRASASVALDLDPDLATLNLGDVRVRRFEQTLPRAYFSACAIRAGNREGVLARLHDPAFDPRLQVILPGEGATECLHEGYAPAKVALYEPERVVLEVEAASEGHVVLLDSYYPGWEARVDGEPVAVERANWFFRSVPITAGQHAIEFVYRPRSLRWGAIISLISVATLMGGALLCLWSARTARGS